LCSVQEEEKDRPVDGGAKSRLEKDAGRKQETEREKKNLS